MASKLTTRQTGAAVRVIAAWLGEFMGLEGPVTMSREAYEHGSGAMFLPDWDNGRPTPTVFAESWRAEDWTVYCSIDRNVIDALGEVGVFAEPVNSAALALYPA
jgi:hypothetical protein